jgi:dihydropteroate synthase
MQLAPTYGDVVAEVGEFLLERASFAVESGVRQEKIWIDPGIGFGKTDDHNLLLIREIGALVETGYPVLLGVSRKGFLGRMLAKDGEPASVNKRMVAGLAVQSYAQLQGVCGFRTHDVRPTAELARTLSSFVRER